MEVLWNRFAQVHTFALVCGYEATELRFRVPSLAELQGISASSTTLFNHGLSEGHQSSCTQGSIPFTMEVSHPVFHRTTQ